MLLPSYGRHSRRGTKRLRSRSGGGHEAFETFRTNLDLTNAGILVEDIAKEEFEAIVDAAPEAADRWYRLFLDLNEGARSTTSSTAILKQLMASFVPFWRHSSEAWECRTEPRPTLALVLQYCIFGPWAIWTTRNASS